MAAQPHQPRRPSGARRFLRILLKVAGAGIVLALTVGLVAAWASLGKRATGPRRTRMEGSAEWHEDHFVNPQPLINDARAMLSGLFRSSPFTSPQGPVPVATGGGTRFATPPPTGLRVTWFGHSSTLVEIDGHRVLTDPVWSERASPIPGVGPRAWYAPPLALADLPPIDVVVISHDHYDHLDRRTIVALDDASRNHGWNTTFVVPLGIGAHLAYWGVPDARIVELDWWQQTRAGDLEIVCTPARHASGRMVIDNDAKLWSGWALLGPRHRVYYSGDTGLFPAMRDIGARLGPFDLTMIEAGQYGRGWPDWHLGPEQAVVAHGLVRGKVMLPVHWGKFVLAYHGWTEPIERVLAAGERAGATILSPKPGESVEPEAAPPRQHWWPTLPWKTAAEDPIVSTQLGGDGR